ncbi:MULTISPECIES: DUF805 domain-containing protein [unclassified Meridianimarinicoccus]|uniref:DUF805 domain-containing protein n=1 Tax=unclassified Meridianimarinicoccus TaxID=2923344 RepID=UPI0018674029|nr:DUF805 domain-containing protein [Fluviibacterium sp. MJW13]
MNFQTAIQTCLSKYATFSGRATRPEFWWFVLFVILVGLGGSILDSVIFGTGPEAGQPISAIASLALLLPYLAVGVRRLHDIGRNGWWMLLILLPLIGTLIILYWMVQPSKD